MATVLEESITLTDSQFNEISGFVKDVAGINLHDGKKQLVKARLAKRMRQLGIFCFEEYMGRVRGDKSLAELTAMLDALSTNLTFFFREPRHFDLLRDRILPDILSDGRRDRKIRIWSAGCSSGEEPYSIAILLGEQGPKLAGWDARVLATDLSTRVLASARQGIYDQKRVKDLPKSLITKHFRRLGGRKGDQYEVSPDLRSMVTFARLNLMESWPMRGSFDVIFCRNVMIYFDKQTQGRLVGRFWDMLRPGGMLLLGHSESLTGIKHKYKYFEPATYQRPL